MKCSAQTKAGKRCSRNAVPGTERCKQHTEHLSLDEIFERYEVPPDCQPLLDAYVQLHARRRQASAILERDTLYVVGEDGVYVNPAVAIERQTSAELARLHREIVRSSKPIEAKPAPNSALDQLSAKREARRAGPAAAKA